MGEEAEELPPAETTQPQETLPPAESSQPEGKSHPAESSRPEERPAIPFRAPVRLNVGGSPFTTSYGTLVAREPDSHLAKLFLSITEVDNSGYFFDRDGTHFRYVLNWLRDGHVNLPPDATVLADIRVEASFYGLPSLVAHIVDAENRLAQANQQRQPHGPPAPPSSQPAGGSSSSSRTNGNEGDDTAVRSSADAGVKSINAATMTHESLLQQQKAVQESLLRGLERLLDRIQALQISQAEQAPGRTQGMDRKLVHSKSGPQGSGAGAGVAPGVAPMSPVAPAEAIASHAPSKVMPELDGARLVHRMEQNGLCKVGDVVVRVTYRVLEEFAKSCDRGHCRWESRCQLPLERQVDHDDVAQMVVLELWRRGICATYEVEYECLFSPSAAAVVNRVPRQLLFRGYPLLTLAQQPERAKQWAGWPANLMLLTLASGLVTEGRKMQVELS